MRIRTLSVIAVVMAWAIPYLSAARIPIPDGFPNAQSTGITGAGLTYGDLTAPAGNKITQAGAVIENKDFTGLVTISTDNVTLRNCRVQSASHACILNNGKNALIEYCELVGTAETNGAAIKYGNYTARYCNIYGSSDGLKIGSNTTVENCYIHDQRKHDGSHNDGMQCSGGTSRIVIRGNTIQGPYQTSTSALMFSTQNGTIDDVLIEGNFLSGGSYTVYMTDKGTGYGAPTNVRFANNVWEYDSWARKADGSFREGAYHTGVGTFTCNIFHTGDPLPENPECPTIISDPLPDRVIPVNGLKDMILMDIYGRCIDKPGTGFFLMTGPDREVKKTLIIK